MRRNRITTFVTDAEMQQIEQIAEAEGKSLAMVVYELVARSLKRRR